LNKKLIHPHPLPPSPHNQMLFLKIINIIYSGTIHLSPEEYDEVLSKNAAKASQQAMNELSLSLQSNAGRK